MKIVSGRRDSSGLTAHPGQRERKASSATNHEGHLMTISQILEDTRQAIHEAVAAGNGSEQQRSAAHHAQSLANTVLLDPAAEGRQLDKARDYLAEAIGIQTIERA